MAKILETTPTSDGYDVRCALDTGDTHTFHFSRKPADVPVAVEAAEASFLAALDVAEETLVVSEG